MRAAIVLAAGRSARFGRPDKLLALYKGRPLIAHAVSRAIASGARRTIVVGRPRIAAGLPSRGLSFVRPLRRNDGLSASLAAGLKALRPIEREAWIFLGDMPFATAPRRTRLAPGHMAARPIVAGRPGHPLLVRVASARAATLSGDRGLIASLPRDAIGTWRGRAGDVLDIDDRVALARLRRLSR